jgi:hypothetical protein
MSSLRLWLLPCALALRSGALLARVEESADVLIYGGTASGLAAGIAAADALNQLIATGLASIGRSSALVLTPADLIALNIWIRSDPARLQAFINAHGDDEGDAEQASTAWSTTAPVSCFTATTSSIRSSIPFTTSAFKSMPQATFSMKMVTPTLLCKWSRIG